MNPPHPRRCAPTKYCPLLLMPFVAMATMRPLVAESAEYLVSDRATNQVLRYDADDGSYLGPLVDNNLAENGGLFLPTAMTFGFDRDLFVTSIDLNTGDGQLLRYNAQTGQFQGVFASGLVGPSGLMYHAASNTMLVGSLGTGLGDSNVIARLAADGTRLDDIAAGPISGRTGMVSTPDGKVLVSSFAEEPFFSGSVLQLEYDPATDALNYAGLFAAAPELLGANGLAFDAGGDLYVASLFGQSVVKFDLESGSVVGSSVVAQTAYPSSVLIDTDGNMLVTSLGNNNPSDPIYPDLFPGAVFKFDPATGAMIGAGPFMVGGEEFLPSAILLRGLAGDFDGDSQLTARDIDLLSAAVRDGATATDFDVNGDGLIDNNDREFWVQSLKGTYFGDSDLDGEFNSSDLTIVLAEGEYEDDVLGNSMWATGDWNGDTEFDSGDFVSALEYGGYEVGPRQAVAAVPEPAAALSVSAALALMVFTRRRASRRAA